MLPNVRIARQIRTEQGAIIRTELLGQWFVDPSEWPDSRKAQHIRAEIAAAQAEEPHMGWRLETRGTDRGWHEMTSAASAAPRKGITHA